MGRVIITTSGKVLVETACLYKVNIRLCTDSFKHCHVCTYLDVHVLASLNRSIITIIGCCVVIQKQQKVKLKCSTTFNIINMPYWLCFSPSCTHNGPSLLKNPTGTLLMIMHIFLTINVVRLKLQHNLCSPSSMSSLDIFENLK